MSCAVWCCAALATVPLHASPQDSTSVDGIQESTSVDRIKDRLQKPPAPPLRPVVREQLRPVFRTRIERRPFVPTLEEDLRKTFALTDFQRQYAEYASRCCGIDLGMVFKRIDEALDERRLRKARQQVALELAELERARLSKPK